MADKVRFVCRMTEHDTDLAPGEKRSGPQNHRTIDRVTRILEEVVYNPGITFSELARSLDTAKSSMHGFLQGLLANGWLYEEKGRFFLGAAVYGLTLASGHIQAGIVTHDDLDRLREKSGVGVYLGVRAGDYLIYVSMAGDDPATDFYARSNIRRKLMMTAGGKAILAEETDMSVNQYLRRQTDVDKAEIQEFLQQLQEIRTTRVAFNWTQGKTRFALGASLRNRAGDPMASLTLVASQQKMLPRREELTQMLLDEVQRLEARQFRQGVGG